MSEERDMDLNEERIIIMEDIREGSWRDITDDGDYKSKIHDLR